MLRRIPLKRFGLGIGLVSGPALDGWVSFSSSARSVFGKVVGLA